MANFFLVNRDFHSSREAWFFKIIFRETRNKCLIRREPWFSLCLCYLHCITLHLHGWCLLCCDNVVGLVFGDLWPVIIFILCFVYFDHNGVRQETNEYKASTLSLNVYQTAVHRGEQKFAPVERVEQLEVSRKREEKARLHRGTQEEGAE